jgi:uncharacterized protein YeaO (DUF488 family)
MDIKPKRVYEEAKTEDGCRVLVDRIWPRGMTKEKAGIDLWLKELAPSTTLRQWFNHDRAKWDIFKSRYFLELDQKPHNVNDLIEKAKKGRLTLLFSARDMEHNQATALKEYLICQSKKNVH